MAGIVVAVEGIDGSAPACGIGAPEPDEITAATTTAAAAAVVPAVRNSR